MRNEKDRLSRQNTPLISHEPKWSSKLLDPLIFEGRDQDLDSWLSRMRTSSHRFPTDSLHRKQDWEEVARHIASRLRATSLNRFGTAEEIFDYPTQAYGDPDRQTGKTR
jgi:hypothetical protein